METIFRYGQHVLQYHRQLQLLHLNWAGHVNEDQYRTVMHEVVRLTKTLPVQKWLINMDHAQTLETGDQTWLLDFLARELSGTSLRRVARVDSRIGHYEHQIRRLIAEAHSRNAFSLPIQFFATEHEALAWLSDATFANIP